MKPLGPEWVAPSLLFGEVALCRDPDTQELWVCGLQSEAEGWQKLAPATADRIEAFRNCQTLAGKPAPPKL